jgi:hypothetical protein
MNEPIVEGTVFMVVGGVVIIVLIAIGWFYFQ